MAESGARAELEGSQEPEAGEDRSSEHAWHFRIPDLLKTTGRAAWLFVGIAVAVGIAVFVLGLISSLLIPLIFAAILAAIFVPLVDSLERLRIPRWLGAPLVVLLAIAVVSVVVWMVVDGVVHVGGDVLNRLMSGINEAGALVDAPTLDDAETRTTILNVAETLLSGVLRGLGSVTVLIIGTVTGLFILLFLMKDWLLVFEWTSKRIGVMLGLPIEVSRGIVSDTVTSFRSYAWGLTIIGVMNAAIVGLGALLLDVPLAGSIAIVTFVMSYIPFFGAFLSGAFAVVIALGANGLSTALGILAITLLANNTLQNLLEPVAFGKTLQLHPLVVLVVTTGATLLFGVLGATLAAPVTAVALRTVKLLSSSVSPEGPEMLGVPASEGRTTARTAPPKPAD